MTAVLLAAYLVTQTWAWDPVAEATSYRLYYGPSPHHWCPMQHVEVLASGVCDATECQFQLPEPTGDLIFINVTAIDAGGNESPWDHGVKVCP